MYKKFMLELIIYFLFLSFHSLIRRAGWLAFGSGNTLHMSVCFNRHLARTVCFLDRIFLLFPWFYLFFSKNTPSWKLKVFFFSISTFSFLLQNNYKFVHGYQLMENKLIIYFFSVQLFIFLKANLKMYMFSDKSINND